MSLTFTAHLWSFGPSLLFRSFDVTTAEGRAKERQRRVALTALASVLAKLISVSTALISVPLTLRYLGTERYGMWMTMSSLVTMLGFADLGIGNGLLTSVSSANGRDNRAEIRSIVSSAYAVLSLIALSVVAVFCLSYPLVDWFRIFNVETTVARQEAGPALAVLICCFALAMPVGIVQRVQMGLQCGFMASFWQCFAGLMALGGVLLAIHWQASLPLLLFTYVGAPLLVGFINGATFFLKVAPDIAPSWHLLSTRATRSIVGTGLLFLVLQVTGALAFASDNIIIARMLGAAAVAGYAVPAQAFNLITAVIAMLLAPLWPAYGEAIARNDKAWVKTILRRSLVFSVGVAAILSTVLVAAGPWIIGIWVNHTVSPTFLLLFGFGIWKVIEIGGHALAMFLNGAKVVQPQVITSTLTCIFSIVCKIALIGPLGLPGVVWGTIVSYLLFTAMPYSFMLKGILDRLKM